MEGNNFEHDRQIKEIIMAISTAKLHVLHVFMFHVCLKITSVLIVGNGIVQIQFIIQQLTFQMKIIEDN